MSDAAEAAVVRIRDALRVAQESVALLRDKLEMRDILIRIPAQHDLVVDLARITGRAPDWHLGHLSPEDFERVRARLGASQTLLEHPDGSRFLILAANQGGMMIRAQTTPAPGDPVLASVAAEQPA